MLSLAGLTAAVGATGEFYLALLGSATSKSVHLSRWGNAHGVPFSLLLSLWFASLLTRARREAVPGLSLFSLAPLHLQAVFGLGLVLYSAYGTFFVVHHVSPSWSVIFAVTAGVFAIASRQQGEDGEPLVKRARRSPLAFHVAVVALPLLCLGWFASRAKSDPTTTLAPGVTIDLSSAEGRQSFEQWYGAQLRFPHPIPSDGVRVLVLKFSDLQCPPCKASFTVHREVVDRYAAATQGGVRLVELEFPLEEECNAAVRGTPHPLACEAAAAVKLSGARADALRAWLFQHQSTLSLAEVARAARDVGGVTHVEEQYPSGFKMVAEDVSVGRRLGVNGTPMVFVNGVQLGNPPSDILAAAIEYELRPRGRESK